MNALKDSIEQASQQTKGNWINSVFFFRIEIYKLISDDISQFGNDFAVNVGELKESMSDELNEIKSSYQEIKGIFYHLIQTMWGTHFGGSTLPKASKSWLTQWLRRFQQFRAPHGSICHD